MATGSPIQGAEAMTDVSTMPMKAAHTYETMTPMRTGMILIMPLPHMLQMMITRRAMMATGQLCWQFSRALPERVSPMAMMMGPVTMGGKYFMTFLAPNAFIRAASSTYMSPAHATPKLA